MQIRAKNNSRLHDIKNIRVSLKQWRMLHAVVDHDGFSGAADRLHISQSAISYTLSKLQEQLGVSLLKVEGRKAHITEEGRMLLDYSRPLLKAALELEALALNLRLGLGVEVRLLIDHHFPSDLLMRALLKFSKFGSKNSVCLAEANATEAKKALHENKADLAISSYVPLGYVGSHLIELEYVIVAHPDHTLFQLGRCIETEDLGRHVQIVILDQDECVLDEKKSCLLESVRRWRVGSFDTACAALAAGLGYAWMPKHRIQDLFDNGDLAILPMHSDQSYLINLYLVHGDGRLHNSGAGKLAEILHQVVAARALSGEMRSTQTTRMMGT
ncbi:MAG: LysR family transcriptional regulator [Burkholderiaceae bacterium]